VARGQRERRGEKYNGHERKAEMRKREQNILLDSIRGWYMKAQV